MLEKLDTNDLRLLLAYCDKNSPKLELNGIWINGEKGHMVSTNTRALIVLKTAPSDVNNIVHRDSVELLTKLTTVNMSKGVWISNEKLSNGNGEKVIDGIGMQTYDIHSRDKKENVMVVGSVIHGKFPDYTRIIADESKYDTDWDGETKYSDDNNEKPITKMKAEKVHAEFLKQSIAMTGTVVDDAYMKPIMDYIKQKGISEVTLKFISTAHPIYVEHDNFDFVVMPVVF